MQRQNWCGLLHAVGGIPDALEFADVDDLADVVGVVSADVSDERSVFLELGVIGGLDGLLPVGEDSVEAVDGLLPGFGVKIVEGFIVVAVVFGRLLAFEAGKRFGIPEKKMISELADRVIAALIGPRGLLGSKARDGEADGDEPVLFVMGGAKLLEQDTAKGGRRLLLLRKSGDGEEQKGNGERRFHGGFSCIEKGDCKYRLDGDRVEMACKGFRAKGARVESRELRRPLRQEAREARVFFGWGYAQQGNHAAERRGDAGRGGPKAMRIRIGAGSKVLLVILIIGGLNWLMVGLFRLNLIAMVLGNESAASRIAYVIVGIAALYCLKFVVGKTGVPLEGPPPAANMR